MDHDSHWSLVKFDTDYWNLVERCFSVTQSAEGVATETCVEHATASARPQGSRCYTAEYFRSKFEAMEREFSEEFKVMSRPPASTEDDDNRDGEQAQVIHFANVEITTPCHFIFTITPVFLGGFLTFCTSGNIKEYSTI